MDCPVPGVSAGSTVAVPSLLSFSPPSPSPRPYIPADLAVSWSLASVRMLADNQVDTLPMGFGAVNLEHQETFAIPRHEDLVGEF